MHGAHLPRLHPCILLIHAHTSSGACNLPSGAACPLTPWNPGADAGRVGALCGGLRHHPQRARHCALAASAPARPPRLRCVITDAAGCGRCTITCRYPFPQFLSAAMAHPTFHLGGVSRTAWRVRQRPSSTSRTPCPAGLSPHVAGPSPPGPPGTQHPNAPALLFLTCAAYYCPTLHPSRFGAPRAPGEEMRPVKLRTIVKTYSAAKVRGWVGGGRRVGVSRIMSCLCSVQWT